MTDPMKSRDIGELVLFLQDGGEHTKHELNTLNRLIAENEYRAEVVNKRDGTIKRLEKIKSRINVIANDGTYTDSWGCRNLNEGAVDELVELTK